MFAASRARSEFLGAFTSQLPAHAGDSVLLMANQRGVGAVGAGHQLLVCALLQQPSLRSHRIC